MEQELSPEFSQYVPDILESHAEMVARAILALPIATVLSADGVAERHRDRRPSLTLIV